MKTESQSYQSDHQCACMLAKCYADLQMLYLLVSGCHRNITGPNFYSLHLMLGEMYGSIAEQVDSLGEHIRGCYHVRLPMSPDALKSFSQIQFPPETVDANTFLTAIIMACQVLESSIYSALAETKNCGTKNLLEGFCTDNSSRIYLLQSHLEP